MPEPTPAIGRPQPPLQRPATPLTDGEIELDVVRDADVPAIVRICNDPLAATWLPLPQPYTEESARDWMMTSAESEARAGSLEFAIRDAEGVYAGSVGLHLERSRTDEAEIGYLVGPDHRRQGFASRATRLLAAWAFAGIVQGDGSRWAPRRIELLVAPDNVASRRACEKAGATFEGLRRAGIWLATTGVHDAAVYSLLASDL